MKNIFLLKMSAYFLSLILTQNTFSNDLVMVDGRIIKNGLFQVTGSAVSVGGPTFYRDLLLDFENTCRKNCRYYNPIVKESKIVQNNTHHIIFWAAIKEKKSSEFFSIARITEQDKKIEISIRLLSDAQGELWSDRTGLAHDPIFNVFDVVWTLEPYQNDSTLIRFKLKASSKSFWIKRFSKMVKRSLIKNIKIQFKDLQKEALLRFH